MKKDVKMAKLTKREILRFLKQNKEFLKSEFGVTKIALFGSYARGEQTKNSDIDLLIEMKKPNFRKRLRLRDFLQDYFGKKVEIGYFESVRTFIMCKIERDLAYV